MRLGHSVTRYRAAQVVLRIEWARSPMARTAECRVLWDWLSMGRFRPLHGTWMPMPAPTWRWARSGRDLRPLVPGGPRPTIAQMSWYLRVIEQPDGQWACRRGAIRFDAHDHLVDALRHLHEIAGNLDGAVEFMVHLTSGEVCTVDPNPRDVRAAAQRIVGRSPGPHRAVRPTPG